MDKQQLEGLEQQTEVRVYNVCAAKLCAATGGGFRCVCEVEMRKEMRDGTIGRLWYRKKSNIENKMRIARRICDGGGSVSANRTGGQ